MLCMGNNSTRDGTKKFRLYDFNMLLKSLRTARLGGEGMAIHGKNHKLLYASEKCLTAFEWEFCNMDNCQIFDHMEAQRMRVGLCTWYKNERTCSDSFYNTVIWRIFWKIRYSWNKSPWESNIYTWKNVNFPQDMGLHKRLDQ